MNSKPPTIPFGIAACTFSDNLFQNSCMRRLSKAPLHHSLKRASTLLIMKIFFLSSKFHDHAALKSSKSLQSFVLKRQILSDYWIRLSHVKNYLERCYHFSIRTILHITVRKLNLTTVILLLSLNHGPISRQGFRIQTDFFSRKCSSKSR